MKKFKEYINEHRTVDEVKIYQGNKEITPIQYVYDEKSLNDFIEFYKVNNKYFEGKVLKICHLNNNKWKTLKGEGSFELYRPNDNYYTQGKMVLSYQELVEYLNNGKYILILINQE